MHHCVISLISHLRPCTQVRPPGRRGTQGADDEAPRHRGQHRAVLVGGEAGEVPPQLRPAQRHLPGAAAARARPKGR